jgi:ATP-dependent exoDNAse (exonuclease V) beta subunit
VVPLSIEGPADEVSAKEHELQERCLLYVASTRARDELVIVGFGRRSPFL